MSDSNEIKFDLVKPKDVIEWYFNIWNNGCNDKDKEIQLFPSIKVDVSKFKCINNKVYNDQDKEINKLFSEICKNPDNFNGYKDAVKKLDKTYNTMINDKYKETALNIFDTRNEIFEIKEQIIHESKQKQNNYKLKKELVDLIACINKKDGGKYAYSFATKFCSFLIKDEFPIFDSIVSTLVWTYLKNNKSDCSHDKMGDYGYYLEKYKEFIEKYSLKAYSFKQIDIFLWLYGKIMTEYWEKIGVIRFSSVYYRDPTK